MLGQFPLVFDQPVCGVGRSIGRPAGLWFCTLGPWADCGRIGRVSDRSAGWFVGLWIGLVGLWIGLVGLWLTGTLGRLYLQIEICVERV